MNKKEDMESNKKEPLSFEKPSLTFREKFQIFCKVKAEKKKQSRIANQSERLNTTPEEKPQNLSYREKRNLFLKLKEEKRLLEEEKEKEAESNEPKYLNQFHKESTEKSLKAIEEMRKTPINYEEELKRHREMHERAKEEDKKTIEAWKTKHP